MPLAAHEETHFHSPFLRFQSKTVTLVLVTSFGKPTTLCQFFHTIRISDTTDHSTQD